MSTKVIARFQGRGSVLLAKRIEQDYGNYDLRTMYF